jgi:uncharacterized membrane protein YdcZ (DUF606 family)
MDRGLALVLTLVVGGLVALQPPANALMSREVAASARRSSRWLISISIIGVLLVAFATRTLRGITAFRRVGARRDRRARRSCSSRSSRSSAGRRGVTAALVATQLTVSAIADRFGWLGSTASLQHRPIAGVLL